MELSKTGALVLSLVSETPMGAYDMVGILNKVNIRRWFPLSDSSVYVTVKTLEKRFLISGREVREGNMPEKTVYAITAKGSEVLGNALNLFLLSKYASNPEFDIAMLFLCHLKKRDVLQRLREKQVRLEEAIERAANQYRNIEKDPRVPFIGRCMVRHNQYLKEAELRTVRELLEQVEASDSWDYFITNDLK